MAELETTRCCSPAEQTGCCEADDKAECCGSGGSSCGCRSGQQVPLDVGEVQEAVRERYAAVATTVSESATLGCGNPIAVAELNPGEIVLDLGSGGGLDVLLSAARVGPTGRAYGLDMTDEMLDLARRSQSEAAVENVEFVRGKIEDVPLPDDSVDVVISNCVINLSDDKPAVFREAARVLRPGCRFAVSDVIADPEMDEGTRRDLAQWTGCIAGALTEDEFRRELAAAGFEEIGVQETHRVHDHAGSATIRALRKVSPGAGG